VGVDIVCTFGPAATLTTNYYTPIYPQLNVRGGLLIAVALAICSALAMWHKDRAWCGNLLATVVLAGAITLATMSRDAFMPGGPLR
jgi:hypothetical protein